MTKWIRAAATDEIADDSVTGLRIGGCRIALYKSAGTLYATDDICTHGEAQLSDGCFDPDSCTVECPRHAGVFDVATGEPLTGPIAIPVRTYRVKRQGDDILIEL